MKPAELFEPSLPTLIGTVGLTAVFLYLEANTIARTCALLRCMEMQPGWEQFSVFPHCCVTMSGYQLFLEYLLLVLAPLLISYVLVSIGVWAYKHRKDF